MLSGATGHRFNCISPSQPQLNQKAKCTQTVIWFDIKKTLHTTPPLLSQGTRAVTGSKARSKIIDNGMELVAILNPAQFVKKETGDPEQLLHDFKEYEKGFLKLLLALGMARVHHWYNTSLIYAYIIWH